MAVPMQLSDDEVEEQPVRKKQSKFTLVQHLYTSGRNARLMLKSFKKEINENNEMILNKQIKSEENYPVSKLGDVIQQLSRERGRNIHSVMIKIPDSSDFPETGRRKLQKALRAHIKNIAIDPFRAEFKTLVHTLAPARDSRHVQRPVVEEEEQPTVTIEDIEYEYTNYKFSYTTETNPLNNNRNNQRSGRNNNNNNNININNIIATSGCKSTMARTLSVQYFQAFQSSEICLSNSQMIMFVIDGAFAINLGGNMIELRKHQSLRITENLKCFLQVNQAGGSIFINVINTGIVKGTQEFREATDKILFFEEIINDDE